MTLEMAFQIVMGLLATIGSFLLRWAFSEIKELRKSLEKYQLKDDAREGESRLMVAMKEIKQQLQNIDNKLDRKADK